MSLTCIVHGCGEPSVAGKWQVLCGLHAAKMDALAPNTPHEGLDDETLRAATAWNTVVLAKSATGHLVKGGGRGGKPMFADADETARFVASFIGCVVAMERRGLWGDGK